MILCFWISRDILNYRRISPTVSTANRRIGREHSQAGGGSQFTRAVRLCARGEIHLSAESATIMHNADRICDNST